MYVTGDFSRRIIMIRLYKDVKSWGIPNLMCEYEVFSARINSENYTSEDWRIYKRVSDEVRRRLEHYNELLGIDKK